MGDMEAQLATSCLQAKVLAIGLGCISHGNSQTTQADVKTNGCSLQTDNSAALPRTTQLMEHGKVELMPTWSIHPHIPATKPLIYNLPCL